MPAPASQYAAVTIASMSYLSLARVTASSFKEHNPDIDFFILIADKSTEHVSEATDSMFQFISIDDLQLKGAQSIFFRYTELELTYALTPCVIKHLLDRKYQGVMFLKQETLVLGKLDSIASHFSCSSVLLTPHLLEPIRSETGVEWELNVLLAGVFNGGFAGFSDTSESRIFLDWWAEKTLKECFRDVENGLHFEQRWLDFVPSYVTSYTIIRDPGVNVGHWNLLDRDIRIIDNEITAKGVPCRVFRFSGYDPDIPDRLTRYNHHLTIDNIGDAAEVLRKYQTMLSQAKYQETKSHPYAFGRFDNGVAITDKVRRVYIDLGESVSQFGNPFETGRTDSFFSWLNSEYPALVPNIPAICTIAFENYLPFVRLLADSIASFHPEIPFFALLISENDMAAEEMNENFNLLQINDLSISGIELVQVSFDRKQLSARLKPTVLKYLLEKGYAPAIFLDPDMLVTASLAGVISTVAKHSLSLTPHVLSPVETDSIPKFDKSLLAAGMYNAGFIGVSPSAESIRFLTWWENKLIDFCLNKPRQGIHYDQRWLDHAAGFIKDLYLLKDPGFNAAYWNLINRTVVFDGQNYWIDGSLLKCIHFSGFDPAILPKSNIYFPDIGISQFGKLSALFYQYGEDLSSQGWTCRPIDIPKNTSVAQNEEGFFDTPLTRGEIQDLAQVKAVQTGPSRSAPILGEFIPVSSFFMSGIMKRFGWSSDEAWGVWSCGSYSDLLITLPCTLQDDFLLVFSVHGFVMPHHPKQEVDVFLNGDYVEKWSFDETGMPEFRSIYVNKHSCLTGILILGFNILNPASPSSLAVSADPRILGIGLKGVKVENTAP